MGNCKTTHTASLTHRWDTSPTPIPYGSASTFYAKGFKINLSYAYKTRELQLTWAAPLPRDEFDQYDVAEPSGVGSSRYVPNMLCTYSNFQGCQGPMQVAVAG